MKLANIQVMGRYLNTETNQSYNIKKGRNSQRGTDILFYLYRGKRQIISDADFYSGKFQRVND